MRRNDLEVTIKHVLDTTEQSFVEALPHLWPLNEADSDVWRRRMAEVLDATDTDTRLWQRRYQWLCRWTEGHPYASAYRTAIALNHIPEALIDGVAQVAHLVEELNAYRSGSYEVLPPGTFDPDKVAPDPSGNSRRDHGSVCDG